MAKIVSLIVFLCSFSTLFSQETTRKGDVEVGLVYGNTRVNSKENEIQGFLNGAKIRKEFILNNRYSIVTGIESFSGYLNSGTTFLDSKYLSIPLSLRAKLEIERSVLFIDLGGYSNYLLRVESRDNTNDTDETFKDLGATFGLFYRLGYKYKVNDSVKVYFCMSANKDFSTSFKSSVPEMKTELQTGIELGLAFVLF